MASNLILALRQPTHQSRREGFNNKGTKLSPSLQTVSSNPKLRSFVSSLFNLPVFFEWDLATSCKIPKKRLGKENHQTTLSAVFGFFARVQEAVHVRREPLLA